MDGHALKKDNGLISFLWAFFINCSIIEVNPVTSSTSKLERCNADLKLVYIQSQIVFASTSSIHKVLIKLHQQQIGPPKSTLIEI